MCLLHRWQAYRTRMRHRWAHNPAAGLNVSIITDKAVFSKHLGRAPGRQSSRHTVKTKDDLSRANVSEVFWLLLIKTGAKWESLTAYWLHIFDEAWTDFLLQLSGLTLLPLPAVKSQVVVKCLPARGSAYHTVLTSSLHKHPAVPTAGFLWIMVQHRHALILSTSEVIKAPMLATFDRAPTANILHTKPRYVLYVQKHTEAYCAHATLEIARRFMEADRYTVSVLPLNSHVLIPFVSECLSSYLKVS